MRYLCTQGLTGRLTHGKEYEGEKFHSAQGVFIVCTDDRGKPCIYPSSRFFATLLVSRESRNTKNRS